MYRYNERFYDYINAGSAESARRLLPELLRVLQRPVASVLDVGCGAGAWLSVWKTLGARVTGVDGEYLQPRQLLVAPDEFQAADLRRRLELGRRFDLVQSLEVAEHLPAASAAVFVDGLCRHADLVLFSAAPPGQGGENHVNEQPYGYWRDLFAARGFLMYDAVRPAVIADTAIRPWYRYNSFLFVNRDAEPDLHRRLAERRVAATGEVPDLSPVAYRWRKGLVRMLPRPAATALARLKKTANRLWVGAEGGRKQSDA